MRPTKVRARVGSRMSGSSRRPTRRFCAGAGPCLCHGEDRGERQRQCEACGEARRHAAFPVRVGGRRRRLQPGPGAPRLRGARSRARRRQAACPGSGRPRGAPAGRRRPRPEGFLHRGRSPCAKGQRVWKRQPAGGSIGLGTSPCSGGAARARARARRPAARGYRDGAARAKTASAGPSSTMRPRYITATRSAMCRTTPRSWLMSTKARPSSRIRSCSRFRTCACTETSSALTGSSPTISRGPLASARAMAMRWRWPPENSCGQRPRCSGPQPDAPSRPPRAPAPRARHDAVQPQRLGHGRRHRHARVQAGEGVLEDHLHVAPARAQRGRRQRARSSPRKRTAAGIRLVSRRARRPRVDLPQPLSPTRPAPRRCRTESDTPSTARTAPAAGPACPAPGMPRDAVEAEDGAVGAGIGCGITRRPASRPAAPGGRRERWPGATLAERRLRAADRRCGRGSAA